MESSSRVHSSESSDYSQKKSYSSKASHEKGQSNISQFRAMFYRKWIGTKRSFKSVLINIIVTIIVSCLAILIKYLTESLFNDINLDLNFNAYGAASNNFVIVASDLKNNFANKPFQLRYIQTIEDLLSNDVGHKVDLKIFEDKTSADKFVYQCEENSTFVPMGVILPEEFNPNGGNNLTMIYNDTRTSTAKSKLILDLGLVTLSNLYRIELATLSKQTNFSEPKFNNLPSAVKTQLESLYKQTGLRNVDFSLKYNLLNTNGRDVLFSVISPLLIAAGLMSIISTVIVNPITEIQGPIRSYMVSSGLTILPYWIVTFIFDIAIWIIEVIIVWAIFILAKIDVFSDNKGVTLYVLIICGFSIMMFIYAYSFIFKSADSASRIAFLSVLIVLLIPVIVYLLTFDEKDPAGSITKIKNTKWVYCLFPPVLLEGYLQNVFLEYEYQSEGIIHYFKTDSNAFPYSIFAFIDIFIYGFILFLIEHFREETQRKKAKASYGNYQSFFEEQKNKHPVTEEAKQMEDEVNNSSNEYAVKISKVSRMFFNTEGKPIPAVNSVSLGVEKGSLFGFLGANGAGKTTLMSMITSMLPPSDGTIEIDGIDITQMKKNTKLAVCPQFNTHLCADLTISEHFHLYSLLHNLEKKDEKSKCDKLINILEMESIKDIPIRELSDGDQRKLCIALSFLGQAEIILLDEPTATLDPVSRHQVHEMLLHYRGKKTFMLCTHILSEAEALCDKISIMIKGNVYTVGSPQYLSAKFGTELKIDMQLKDDSEKTGDIVDKFFTENIPQAVLSIKRPLARIYSVPADSISLGVLFEKMEQGMNKNGYVYYTCSSSSLEKVFMEIVRISENDGSEL